jgi:hypothetical protein
MSSKYDAVLKCDSEIVALLGTGHGFSTFPYISLAKHSSLICVIIFVPPLP